VKPTFIFVAVAQSSIPNQAAKSLCKIWCPQDIPIVLLTSKVTVGSEQQAPLHPKSRRRNTQWPSPHSLPVSKEKEGAQERKRDEDVEMGKLAFFFWSQQ
jgi:hypothetical protein